MKGYSALLSFPASSGYLLLSSISLQLPRGGSDSGELGPPTSITGQGNAPQDTPTAQLDGVNHPTEGALPKESRLCQPENKQTNNKPSKHRGLCSHHILRVILMSPSFNPEKVGSSNNVSPISFLQNPEPWHKPLEHQNMLLLGPPNLPGAGQSVSPYSHSRHNPGTAFEAQEKWC